MSNETELSLGYQFQKFNIADLQGAYLHHGQNQTKLVF